MTINCWKKETYSPIDQKNRFMNTKRQMKAFRRHIIFWLNVRTNRHRYKHTHTHKHKKRYTFLIVMFEGK